MSVLGLSELAVEAADVVTKVCFLLRVCPDVDGVDVVDVEEEVEDFTDVWAIVRLLCTLLETVVPDCKTLTILLVPLLAPDVDKMAAVGLEGVLLIAVGFNKLLLFEGFAACLTSAGVTAFGVDLCAVTRIFPDP